MEQDEIMKILTEIAIDVLGVDEDEITMQTTFDDLDADSLDLLSLVTGVEDEFDLEIPDEELENLESMEDIVELIERLQE